MNETQLIARGLEADRICSNEVYQGAWEAIQRDLYKAWAESPREDVAYRERLHLELDVLVRLKGKFAGYMAEAEMTKHNQQFNATDGA
ncbi:MULTISPECIES: hypothetical protein [unclassified Rhizobium]|uniref:hypothetical protein n=1 Tax=unclassified Rhizobium TaxID=2613769 RepID=UPI00115F6693|nr:MULTISPECIES: hypothetical protein [unclassified Rhizobium]TQX90265.1 hypothetical protein EQW76_11220 [Rhizobium sp. rho-13.1]TQY16215.1 hypothetical protein EQW74_10810 [Rhizobium sp. rho-1.1]